MKTICVVANCYNERGNIAELYRRIVLIFETLKKYNFTLLFIDNFSIDGTRDEIEELCKTDKRVRAIFNSRNFGHVRSPFHGFLQAEGDAVITMVSDLQVDPEIIYEYVKKWEEGNDLVIGVKMNNVDSFVLKIFKNAFYFIINRLSDIPLKKNFIGMGLYDRKVVDALKAYSSDPYPYFRGLVLEVGFKLAEVSYEYHGRKRGVSKNNFLTLYDLAMLGIVSHSKIPLRLCTLTGFIFSFLSFFIGLFYLGYKLMYWDSFRLGLAPIMVGIFLIGSLQLMFMGIIGEYVGFIFTKLQKHPHVIEERRINF